jgi:L-ascorbate metabolism protein UlaG (beta-lactamase superfamily)
VRRLLRARSEGGNLRAMSGSLTWLGHSSFRLDTPAGTRVYIDPFLTGNPSCPPQEAEPERCDLILLTHGHGDHVGDTVALHERFGCPLVAQVELRGWLTEQGVASDGMAHSPNKGGTVHVGGVSVTLTTANHSSSANDGRYLGEPCGLVVRSGGMPTIYFAGDTNVFGDMALIRQLYVPDVAVLPIGDHFTMGPHEAALAAELVGATRIVPCHWGTFGLLTGTPETLAPLLLAGVELVAPAPGHTVDL